MTMTHPVTPSNKMAVITLQYALLIMTVTPFCLIIRFHTEFGT